MLAIDLKIHVDADVDRQEAFERKLFFFHGKELGDLLHSGGEGITLTVTHTSCY